MGLAETLLLFIGVLCLCLGILADEATTPISLNEAAFLKGIVLPDDSCTAPLDPALSLPVVITFLYVNDETSTRLVKTLDTLYTSWTPYRTFLSLLSESHVMT